MSLRKIFLGIFFVFFKIKWIRKKRENVGKNTNVYSFIICEGKMFKKTFKALIITFAMLVNVNATTPDISKRSEISEVSATEMSVLSKLDKITSPKTETIYMPTNIKGVHHCLQCEGSCCFVSSRILPIASILCGLGSVGISIYTTLADLDDVKTLSAINAALTSASIVINGVLMKINSKIQHIDKALSNA